MSKKKDSTTIVRIEANSNIYAFNGLVPENRAEGVLKFILKNFILLKERNIGHMEVTKLKVTTSVVNPTLL